MIFDFLFMGLFIAGLVTAILTAIYIIDGWRKKVRSTVNLGFYFLPISVVCLGLGFWFFYVFEPGVRDKRVIEFAGKYQADLTIASKKVKVVDTTYYLTLMTDRTFKLDSMPGMDFWGVGTWNAEGPDGELLFFDSSGSLLDWAIPFGEPDERLVIFNYGDNETRFKEMTTNKK
jgi:hypothetical protein